MRKNLFYLFLPALIAFSVFLFPLKNVSAETQQESRCYSECAVYKFAWVGDACFDMVQNNCSIGTTDMAIKAVSFIKSAYSLIGKGELSMIIGVGDVFKAMFICKPLIEDCIVPQLNSCKTACDYNPYYYAANISVGSPYSNYLRGVYYSDSKKELRFKVVNNGLGYAWDIGTNASWGSTPNRDGIVSGGNELFDETIPELLFLGSRQGSPPTLGSTVVDFLIDESNFSNFLSKYKSDADWHYIPPVWEKVVPFDAPDGELTKVFFNVDSDQTIPESNENDNSFILEIDNRPTPAKFEFDGIEVNLLPNSLNDFSINVKVKNLGEETGNAVLQLFDGNYNTGGYPTGAITQEVPGEGYSVFNFQLEADNANGLPSCHRSKKYSLAVLDPYGGKRTTYFDLPLYAGEISGNVEDLQGKKVVAATVKLSNGMETKTNKWGNYSFKGITELGQYTITVTHPDFTQPQIKDVMMEFNPGDTLQNYCQIPGLLHTKTDFVIKDVPVLLDIKIKNRDGALMPGHVKITCEHASFDFDVAGEGSFPDIQPGDCQFETSSPGYIAQSQTIFLTAPSQDIEFILTKLIGRDSDNGLTIIKPQLLWEKELPDEEFISDITATKNGKLLVFYASNSHVKYGKLYFIDPQTGNEISVTDVPYTTVAQGNVDIDSSYDGRTIGMMIKDSPLNKRDSSVKLFNAAGQEYNNTTVDRRFDTFMEVSPDGTYVYGAQLMNNSLHKYTKGEIKSYENSTDPFLIPRSEVLLFTKNNNVISKYKNGYEVMNFKLDSIRQIGTTDAVARVIDTSNSENEIVIRTDKKLHYFSSYGNWEKDAQRDSRHVSAAISVGGEYAIASVGTGGSKALKIYDSSGQDVTPDFTYKDVQFVTANDTGLYFMSVRGEKLGFYKIGTYDSDYTSDEQTDSEQGTDLATNLQVFNYVAKNFEDTPATSWFDLIGSFMYKATSRLTLNTDFGTITFSKGTIFTRWEQKPVVIFGQAEIHATKPIEMTLLKIKLYDPVVFYDKLIDYYNNQLSEDEFVLVKNYHTDFTTETKKGLVTVSVQDGEVETTFNKQKVVISEGNKLKIDANNKYKVTKSYFQAISYKLLLIILGIFTAIIAFVEIKYKNSIVIIKCNKLLVIIAKKLGILVKNIFNLITKILKIFKKEKNDHATIKKE